MGRAADTAMCFLTLVTHLLPVLVLAGRVSSEDIAKETLHPSYNDEIYDLGEELSGNDHLNPGHSVIDSYEIQSTTVSSNPTTTGQPLLSSAVDEERSNSNLGENLIAVTIQMENLNGVTTKSFSDDTDGNVSEGTTETIGNNGDTTEFFSVKLTSSDITQDQRNQTDLETPITVNVPSPEGLENLVHADDVQLSSSTPRSNDEPESGTGKMNPNAKSTVEPIIDPIANMETSAKSNSVSSTADKSARNEPIDNQNLKSNGAVQSYSEFFDKVFSKPANTETAQRMNVSEYNSPHSQYPETINGGYAADDLKPGGGIKDEESPVIKKENSSEGTPENWRSVLQSIVPSQKERLHFNEKMLQSIQNTVSNSNVNHNVMNNAVTLPCSHSIPPASSNLYPSVHWLSAPIPMPQLPPGVPIESGSPEEYPNFEIEPRYSDIEYADIEKRYLHSPDQFVDPLVEWGFQPVDTNYSPIIHLQGEIIIYGPSQPMTLTHRCRKILVKSEPMCKKESSVCHNSWSGCIPKCRHEHPPQRFEVKLLCKKIWKAISWPGIIYSTPRSDTSDHKPFDEQVGSLDESDRDLLASESDEFHHEMSEHEILPIETSLLEVSESVSAVDDVVPEYEENSAVSEQVFEEAIRKAISEAPEILAPEPIGDLKSEILQEPDPALAPVTRKPVAILRPLQDVDESRKANGKIDKSYVTQPKILSAAVMEKGTKLNDQLEMENDFSHDNANQNVSTNVNLNHNVNFNGIIAVRQPVLPDSQRPIISPVTKPLFHPESGTDNVDLNTNVNVNMNVDINQYHGHDTNHSKQLPVQPIVEPEFNKVTKRLQVEPTMPTFEYEPPSKSVFDVIDVNQNANVDTNSNSNSNRNHSFNDQIVRPHRPKIKFLAVKVIPKVQQPTVLQLAPKVVSGLAVKDSQQSGNANFKSNVNINHNDNANRDVQEPETPGVEDPTDTVIHRNPIVLPVVVLPSITRDNQNGNENKNVNFNTNSNIKQNIIKDREPAALKIAGNVPIIITEPVKIAEPPVEVSTPVYEVPLSPASSSSLNISSNVNLSLNSSVNLNIINETNKNVIQQLLTAPINQLVPTPTPLDAKPKLISVLQVTDRPDTIVHANQNVNRNSNSSLNIDSDQDINQNTTNGATHVLPENFPVESQLMPTQIVVKLPVVNGNDANRDSSINHNTNTNMNINRNYKGAVNVPVVPNLGAPVIIPEPRPVAVVPEFTLPEVFPVAAVSSKVSQNHNINSNTNVNYNSNLYDYINDKIAVTSRQPVSPVIKPVEFQPVAARKHSEIPLLTPAQIDISQNSNANYVVNKNVNVNTNVNVNHNANRNANAKETRELPIIAKKSAMFETVLKNPVVTEIPGIEMEGDNNMPALGRDSILRPNENTELNESEHMNENLNYNSNVNVNQNSNLNGNNDIEIPRISLLPTRRPTPVFIHEPILLPSQAQASILPHAPMVEPEILQSANSSANYDANVNINDDSNSKANFHQKNQIRGQEPILSPPLAPLPWIQESALQPHIIPSGELSVIHDSGVNLTQNMNTNVNHNVNLNQNHNIVSRKRNATARVYEHLNKNNYPSIFEPDMMIAVGTPVLEQKKASIPQATRNSQVNVNQNANVNMNYNSNYNNNANYNGKAVAANENENVKLPLIKPGQNALAPVIVPLSPDRGTGPWNVQKNSNVNANYNSNMNYNANVNANSNYNSNLGQSGLGILIPASGGTHESGPGIQHPILTGNPALSTPLMPNTVIDANKNLAQFSYGAQQNMNSNANYNSNLNYNSNYDANYNHNANYNAQLMNDQKNIEKKGWYELWYNNGEDKDGWTEIWNNKQFERFLGKQLKDMKQQKDIQAHAQPSL